MKLEQSVQTSALLILLLLVILVIYSMGWSGTLHFDDEPNLNGLYGVADVQSALGFAVSGDAGPTGRPLARLSFAIQHESWPNPRPFLVVSTALHLINAILVFVFFQLILKRFSDSPSRSWIALVAASLWVASPFLAPASLVVVQRMTGLSAFFVMVTLVGYLLFRPHYRKSIRSDLLLAVILGVGGLAAGLSKENGLLIPVFVLLTERLLISRLPQLFVPISKKAFFGLLVIPCIAIVTYLAYRGFSSAGYGFRDYSSIERLLTQTRVMVHYIHQLLIPGVQAVTPFHDDWVSSRGLFTPVSTFFSLCALGGLLVIAWVIRIRFPLISFGILWFFCGHLVESTTVPLEFVYPHRNYLPAVGLYFALTLSVWEILRRIEMPSWLIPGVSVAYLALFLAVLGGATSLWGNRALSAEMWWIEKKESIRAGQYLFNHYINDGQIEAAEQFTRHLTRRHEGNPVISYLSLSFCDPTEDSYQKKIDRFILDLQKSPQITVNLMTPIQQLTAIAGQSNCPYFDGDQAERMINAAEPQGRPVQDNALLVLYFSRAQLADHRLQYREAAKWLKRSMEVRPSLEAAQLIAYYLVQSGSRDEAIAFLKRILSEPPVGPIQAIEWKLRLSIILDSLTTPSALNEG